MKNDALEMIELELAVLIRRLTSVSTGKQGANLDRASYLLLHHIHIQGSAGVKALGELLQLDVSTVSRQAAVLEQKGYVVKVPDELDGRAYFYQITENGISELLAFRQHRKDKIAALVKDWPAEEQEQFGRLLAKFNHSLKQRTIK